MKVYATLTHEERTDLRLFLVGELDGHLKHFYLEVLHPKKPWKRSEKIAAGLFKRCAKRFGFDDIEGMFLLEEAAENAGEREED